MPKSKSLLARYDAACRAVTACRTVDQAKGLRDKADAMPALGLGHGTHRPLLFATICEAGFTGGHHPPAWANERPSWPPIDGAGGESRWINAP